MSYASKSHAHKPKKGKGSYDRGSLTTQEREVVTDPREIEETFRKDQELEDEQCLVNTTTGDGATPQKG